MNSLWQVKRKYIIGVRDICSRLKVSIRFFFISPSIFFYCHTHNDCLANDRTEVMEISNGSCCTTNKARSPFHCEPRSLLCVRVSHLMKHLAVFSLFTLSASRRTPSVKLFCNVAIRQMNRQTARRSKKTRAAIKMKMLVCMCFSTYSRKIPNISASARHNKKTDAARVRKKRDVEKAHSGIYAFVFQHRI